LLRAEPDPDSLIGGDAARTLNQPLQLSRKQGHCELNPKAGVHKRRDQQEPNGSGTCIRGRPVSDQPTPSKCTGLSKHYAVTGDLSYISRDRLYSPAPKGPRFGNVPPKTLDRPCAVSELHAWCLKRNDEDLISRMWRRFTSAHPGFSSARDRY